MASTLGANIIDRLVPVVDRIRTAVHPRVGDRQWRVFVVRRVWPAARRGDRSMGPPVATAVELLPAPLVVWDAGRFTFEMQATGKHVDGGVELREVSLTYSSDQLAPEGLPGNVDFYYRIVDGQGQNLPVRYFKPAAPPVPDRSHSIGWVVRLEHAEVAE